MEIHLHGRYSKPIVGFRRLRNPAIARHHLGSDDTPDPAVKAAAHLAYALHNQADAILQGHTFDPQQAIESLIAVDRMLATNFQARLLQSVSHDA